MTTQSYKIADSLFLVRQSVDLKTPKKAVESPVNHLVMIDCSGSMAHDLPQLRSQLKDRLPSLLKERDTISIVWFSGRGECGILFEGLEVSTLVDMEQVKSSIDLWLKPIGLTGFKEPLGRVAGLVDRVGKKNPDGVFSLFFMSDGQDNQWARDEVLKQAEEAGSHVEACTFVEYGYYADRALLTQMAEKCGGSLVFAEDFSRYAPSFEDVLQRRLSGAPKIEVQVKHDVISNFAYSLSENQELQTYSIESGVLRVPENLPCFWYLTACPEGEAMPQSFQGPGDEYPAATYAAISLYAQRMKSDIVLALLKHTGDVRFIESFAKCFGKQRYSQFTEETRIAAFHPSLRLNAGYDPSRVPPDDAFTILDLIQVLVTDPANKILLDSPEFRYSRISRARQDANEVLTADEREAVGLLTSEITRTRDVKKIQELSGRIAAITSKPQPIKFEQDKQPDGYPVSSITFNEERANISLLIRKTGHVDLSTRLPDEPEYSKLQTPFKTHIFRNYAIVKDGLVGIDRLPVKLQAGTVRALLDRGMAESVITNPEGETLDETRARVKKASRDREVEIVLDLTQIPVINRQMVKEVQATKLFELEFELIKARAARKVYAHYLKELQVQTPESCLDPKVQTWLKQAGLSESGPFSPPMVQAESSDYYVAKELLVKVKGYSSLPSVNDVKKKKAQAGVLTPTAALMAPHVSRVESMGKDLSLEWLTSQEGDHARRVRQLIGEMAVIKFSITVGQVWPQEFKSLDENQMNLTLDGMSLNFTLEMREVEVKI